MNHSKIYTLLISAFLLLFCQASFGQLAVSGTITDELPGSTNGAIDITASGGTAPYTYSWTGSVTSEDLTSLGAGNYCVTVTDDLGATVSACYDVLYQILWQNVVNGTTTSKTFTKTSASGTGYSLDQYAGGSSKNYIPEEEDGYVLYDYTSSSGTRVHFGLSAQDQDNLWESIEYAIYLKGSSIYVYESGNLKLTSGGATAGDVFKVERVGTSIKYWKNSTLLKTTTCDDDERLYLDVTIVHNAASTQDMRLSFGPAFGANINVTHGDPLGVNTGSLSVETLGNTGPYTYSWSNSATTNSISNLAPGEYCVTVTDDNSATVAICKTVGYEIDWTDEVDVHTFENAVWPDDGGGDYTRGTASINWLAANENGWLEVEVSTKRGYRGYFGFSERNIDEGHTTVQIGYWLRDGTRRLNKSGYTSNLGAVEVGDVLRIEREGSLMKLYLNGVLDLSEATDPNQELVIDVSLGALRLSKIRTSLNQDLRAVQTITHEDPSNLGSGTIDLSITGGTSPYTYLWSNDATTQDITGLGAGTYSVTITDDNGATLQESYEVAYRLLWDDVTNMTDDANDLHKHTGSASYNAGAGTKNFIPPNTDGSFTFDGVYLYGEARISLAYENTSVNPNDDEVFCYWAEGGDRSYFRLVDGSTTNTNVGSLVRSFQTIKLERVGTTINMYIDGTLEHSETGTDASKLLILDVTIASRYGRIVSGYTSSKEYIDPNTLYWVGGTDDDWSTGSNWSLFPEGGGGTTVPTTGYTAVFGAGASDDCVLSENVTVDAIRFNGDFAHNFDQNGYTVTTTDPVKVEAGGTLSGSPAISLTGDLEITGGEVDFSGGTITVSGDVNFSSGTMNGNGVLTSTSGTVNVQGGTIDAASDITINGDVDLTSGMIQTNTGALTLNDDLTIIGGDLTVEGGSLTVMGITGLNGGNFTAGTQTATVTFSDDFTQTGGSFDGGSVTVTMSGALDLDGGSFKSTSGTLEIKNQLVDPYTRFVHNDGKIIFYDNTIAESSSDFYDVELNTTADLQLNDALTVTNVIDLNDGKLDLNGNSLSLESSATTALDHTNGKIFSNSDDFSGSVFWHIGTATGQYSVPFVDASDNDLTMDLNVTTAGTGSGIVQLSTYQSGSSNDPVPPGVFDLYEPGETTEYGKILNRFWNVSATDYDVLPVATYDLKYTAADLTGTSITEANLELQVWQTYGWEPMSGSVNVPNKKMTLSGTSLFGPALAIDNSAQDIFLYRLTNYATLKKKHDAGIYLAQDGINFKYDGEYNEGDLEYEIYDSERTLKFSNADVTLNKSHGDNRYYIRCHCYPTKFTAGEIYTLEVTNEKDEVFVLRFKYEKVRNCITLPSGHVNQIGLGSNGGGF